MGKGLLLLGQKTVEKMAGKGGKKKDNEKGGKIGRKKGIVKKVGKGTREEGKGESRREKRVLIALSLP